MNTQEEINKAKMIKERAYKKLCDALRVLENRSGEPMPKLHAYAIKLFNDYVSAQEDYRKLVG